MSLDRCSQDVAYTSIFMQKWGQQRGTSGAIINVVWLYGMVTKLVCIILKASKVINDSLPPIICAEVRVVILNYVSPCCFQTFFIRLSCVFCLRTSKRVSLGELISHGFYPLLAMVYKCFNIYLLRHRVYFEYLQVQWRFGGMWWFWCLLEPFECRAAEMHQMFSYGLRPSLRNIEPIFLHKIYIWVSFPIPPVWGHSASYSISYVCFTEEWSVCLAR